jgi:transposase-like protein
MPLTNVERAFSNEEQCRTYLEKLRWPNGPKCPRCNADAWRLTKRFLYECSACHHQFSALIGTIFEKTHLPLSLWFKVIYLMSESKKGISACQIKRMFGIHYRSAWYLCHRVRTAMKTSDIAEKLMGVLEIDETYVGGKTDKPGRPGKDSSKVPVMGMIERKGRVDVKQVRDVTARTIKDFVDRWAGADIEVIYSDQYGATASSIRASSTARLTTASPMSKVTFIPTGLKTSGRY